MEKIEAEEKDRCVLCTKETLYKISTHIDLRDFYVEGAGQLCRECWNQIYEKGR